MDKSMRKSRKLKVEILISAFYFLVSAFAFGQTHTMPGSNIVPSGANLTIQSGGTITAAAGFLPSRDLLAVGM